MQLTRGVWQMSLAMIISGSIGAFVLLSRSGGDWRRGAGRQLAAAVCRLFADLNRYGHRGL